MPNRIIKESICTSKGLSEVSFFASDLYKRLLTYADDYGRFNADFQIILARLYPREIDFVTVDDIEDAMTELVGVGKVTFYVSCGKHDLYGCFPNWSEHQRVRNSKRKMPDPSDVSINDWYLKRFIPIDMKEEILYRDHFTCQECGKHLANEPLSAKRFIKMGAGLFHIDHIVPVNQGGRATMENLRVTCPECNLSRKKRFTFDEILAMTREETAKRGNSPQVAANSGEVRPNPIQSNPIRIQSESNPNDDDDDFDSFWDAYPKKSGDIRQAYFEYLGAIQSGASEEEIIEAVKKQSEVKDARFFPSAEKWLRNRGWTEQTESATPKKKRVTTFMDIGEAERERRENND